MNYINFQDKKTQKSVPFHYNNSKIWKKSRKQSNTFNQGDKISIYWKLQSIDERNLRRYKYVEKVSYAHGLEELIV